MNNFSIENITGPMTQTQRIDGMQIKNPQLSPEAQAIYEQKVTEEMARNGMPTPEMQAQAPSMGNGANFSDVLKKSVEQVNQYQVEADQAVKEMIAGRNKNIHETMLAVERADVSLKLMMQVRNKIIDAYKEVMRMQI